MLEYQILFPPVMNLFLIARSDDMSEDSDDDIDTVTETDPVSDMTDSVSEKEGFCPPNEGNFLETIQVNMYLHFYHFISFIGLIKKTYHLCRRMETKTYKLC